MRIYLIKPKNKIIHDNSYIIIDYIIDKNGNFIETKTNQNILNNMVSDYKYYIYAPYPINLLAIPKFKQKNIEFIYTEKPNFWHIKILLLYLRIERYLRGSDTYSNLMQKILIINFDNKLNDIYFISINNWIKALKLIKREKF